VNPEQWARVKEAFSFVDTLPPDRARDAVRAFCGPDQELLDCVLDLIDRHYEQEARALTLHAAAQPAGGTPAVEFTTHEETEFAGGRFRKIRALGSGAFGDVYLVADPDRGEVALKVLRNTSTLLYFKREFRSLAGIHHRNIVTLHELIRHEERWMFTMARVEGVMLHAFLDGCRPEDRDVCLRGSLRQLAEGLHALHRLKLVHRDVKPSHVLVTPGGDVVLLDSRARRSTCRRSRSSAALSPRPVTGMRSV
jgi:hypothetical protein